MFICVIDKCLLSLQSQKISTYMETRKLTELEAEFIDAVRNYKRAYPNGSDELEWYIQGLYEQLLERD